MVDLLPFAIREQPRDQDGELKESRVFIQLTDEQRGLLNELKAASARAAVSRVAPR